MQAKCARCPVNFARHSCTLHELLTILPGVGTCLQEYCAFVAHLFCTCFAHVAHRFFSLFEHFVHVFLRMLCTCFAHLCKCFAHCLPTELRHNPRMPPTTDAAANHSIDCQMNTKIQQKALNMQRGPLSARPIVNRLTTEKWITNFAKPVQNPRNKK